MHLLLAADRAVNTAAGDVLITIGRKERGLRHQPGKCRKHCQLRETATNGHPLNSACGLGPSTPVVPLFLPCTAAFLFPDLAFVKARPGEAARYSTEWP